MENLVIGRGPVGVVASQALLNKSLNVLNIDIGSNAKLSVQDLVVNSNINYTAAIKPPSLFKEGNDHLWGGACMGWHYFKKDESEKTALPRLPVSEISFAKACKELSTILRISNFDFSKDLPIFSLKFRKTRNLRFVFAKIVKDPYMTKQIENLHSNPNYKFLSNVIIDKVSQEGESILCEGRFIDSNEQIKFLCKRVFLSAGTISNTIILNESNLYSINRNYLGNFLSDHVSFPIASMATRDLLEVERKFGYRKSVKGTKIWPRAKLINEDSSTLDSFCYATEIEASTEMGNWVLGLLRRFPSLHILIRVKVRGKFQLNLFSEVFNSTNNVIMSKDAGGKSFVNFFLSKSDLTDISNIANTYIENLSKTRMMKNGSTTIIFDFEKNLQMVQAGSHPSGTYRMSSSPEEGVVNQFSQLHSHPNVFALGAGALPRSAATHPTFTAMVLALIAVDSIKN